MYSDLLAEARFNDGGINVSVEATIENPELIMQDAIAVSVAGVNQIWLQWLGLVRLCGEYVT
ncbi:MAG: hypothetical protein RQ859_00685 [Pyrobaculum sp.]|nr:hypothetical protein [Pyrobaculum sp.]